MVMGKLTCFYYHEEPEEKEGKRNIDSARPLWLN
jgi:hypothetical protein